MRISESERESRQNRGRSVESPVLFAGHSDEFCGKRTLTKENDEEKPSK